MKTIIECIVCGNDITNDKKIPFKLGGYLCKTCKKYGCDENGDLLFLTNLILGRIEKSKEQCKMCKDFYEPKDIYNYNGTWLCDDCKQECVDSEYGYAKHSI